MSVGEAGSYVRGWGVASTCTAEPLKRECAKEFGSHDSWTMRCERSSYNWDMLAHLLAGWRLLYDFAGGCGTDDDGRAGVIVAEGGMPCDMGSDTKSSLLP